MTDKKYKEDGMYCVSDDMTPEEAKRLLELSVLHNSYYLTPSERRHQLSKKMKEGRLEISFD